MVVSTSERSGGAGNVDVSVFSNTLERKGGGGSSSSPAMIVNRSMLALAEQLREDARLANEQLANNEIE